MLYRDYGKTGAQVSVIGMGGMRFLPEEYEKRDFDKSAQVVLRAAELGVNYFDTAPTYCGSSSQLIMGRAFAQMKGKYQFYVSTKCGSWLAKNGGEARAILEQSLKELGVEKIDFYHLWSLKTMDDFYEYTKKDGIYEAAVKAKEEGLIDHICFSTHMNGTDIAKVVETGLFEGVTLGYNAINFAFRQQGLEACRKAGMGVSIMNPSGGGVIPQHPDYFSFIRRNPEDSLNVAALKFVVSQPGVTLALSGMSTVEEAEENVKAGENVTFMSPEEREQIALHLSGGLNSLCTGCCYCDHCPVGLPVPKLMDCYNEYILRGTDEAIHRRLNLHWSIDGALAKQCVACGKCESLCTQKLPIIDRLRRIGSLFTPH